MPSLSSHTIAGGIAAFGLVLALVPGLGFAQDDPRVEALMDRAADISGCYELRWSSWNEAGWSEETNRLPPKVWLTMSSFGPRYYPNDSAHVAIRFVLRPAPGEREGRYPDATWAARSENDSIVLSWSSPFQGISAVLDVTGSFGQWTLSGRATAWTDQIEIVQHGQRPRAPPSATVSGRMVDCAEHGRRRQDLGGTPRPLGRQSP